MPKQKEQNNKVDIDTKKIEKQIIKNIKQDVKDDLKEEIKPELKEEIKPELKEELKPELTEELMEDLLLIIDKESKNKLDKIERKITRRKNMSIFRKIIIIILLLLVIAYETKLLYENNLIPYFQKQNTTTEVNNKDDVSKKNTVSKTKDLYLENYSYLLNNIKTDLTDENTYYLYKSNYKELTIKNDIRLNMAYQLLTESDKKTENNVITISNDTLKASYKKIFGTTTNYKESNFNSNCLIFIYDNVTDNYLAINTTCEEQNTKLIEKITNIYEQDNNVIIETVVGVYNKDTNKLTKTDKTEVLDTYTEDINLEEYKNILDNYKYTFKNIDNNYYFDSIEKIN